MATNDMTVSFGSYASAISSEAKADGAFSSVSSDVATVITDSTQQTYPLLDFKLELTTTTPTENGQVHLYRIPGDATDTAPTPAGSYKQQYVGSFTLDNALDDYYLYGVANIDPNDAFILENDDGTATLTWILHMRSRTTTPAA